MRIFQFLYSFQFQNDFVVAYKPRIYTDVCDTSQNNPINPCNLCSKVIRVPLNYLVSFRMC